MAQPLIVNRIQAGQKQSPWHEVAATDWLACLQNWESCSEPAMKVLYHWKVRIRSSNFGIRKGCPAPDILTASSMFSRQPRMSAASQETLASWKLPDLSRGWKNRWKRCCLSFKWIDLWINSKTGEIDQPSWQGTSSNGHTWWWMG